MINTSNTTGLDHLQIARIKRGIRKVEAQPNDTVAFDAQGDPVEWWGYASGGVSGRVDLQYPTYPFTAPDDFFYADPNGTVFYRRPYISTWGQGQVQLYAVNSQGQAFPQEIVDPDTRQVTARMITVWNWGKNSIPANYWVKIEWNGYRWQISNADCAPVQ